MRICQLRLYNFRNYKEATVTFSSGINLIEGANAQGKTNLLEAIYLLSTGKSFRTPNLSDLIRHGENYFYLEAIFEKDSVEQALKVAYDGSKRRLEINTTTYDTFLPLLGLLPTVLFAPEDGAIVTGVPADRRRFLDLHLTQTDTLYLQHLCRYIRAMKQRNALLRAQSEEGIEAWEQIMVVSAEYIMTKRREAIDLLNPHVNTHMNKFSSSRDALHITYAPSYHAEETLTDLYKKLRPKELILGSTSIGPHRDNMTIHINEQPAKTFSSEGQKRCSIAALRFAQWHRFHETAASPPLLCIDDFGVHLDEERRSFLHEQTATLGQVFLTSPSFARSFTAARETRTIQVSSGKIG